jgi:hypothetical protein
VRQKNGTRGPDLAPRFASGAEGLAGMKKRLFMHIGLPKTGTTAIQTFCREHRSVLEDHDLYYPAPLPGLHGHSDICPTRKPLLGKDDDIDANMEKRVSSILSSSCRRALISEEALLQSTPSELRVFFDTFDVCVIAYLRSPMLLEHSALLYEGFSYMLDSKSPLGVSPLGRRRRESGAPIRSRAAYGALCENWLSALPAGSVVVRDFDGVPNGELVADFLEMLDVNDVDVADVADVSAENVSLKTDYHFFLSHSNLIPLKFSERIELWRNLGRLSSEADSAAKYRLLFDVDLDRVAPEALETFRVVSELIGRPDYYEHGVRKLRALPEVPYENLPPERMQEIYRELDPPVRESIREAWGKKPDEVGRQPLPKFPPANVEFLFDRLHRRLNELTKPEQERQERRARHEVRIYRLVWRVLNALLERRRR